jgi:pSer/pThr/pTyr-binding forkhead associated (FHA) protein
MPRAARAAGAEGGAVRGAMGMREADAPPSPLSLRFPPGAGSEFSIGRDASCDLAIADMTVSRRHATLERTPDGWLISDLESTNGTRVNGWRVRGKVTVKAGDLISFGNLEAVFAREDTVPPTRPPTVPPTASPADIPAPGVP